MRLVWQEGKYTAYRCLTCGCVSVPAERLNPVAIYGEKYFRRWYLSSIHKRRRYTRRLFSLVEKYLLPGGSLLDVGCGVGTFLSVAQEAGWKVMGIEVSAFATNWCRKQGFTVIQKSFTEMEVSETFDVITFWDVLAHVPEAADYLHCCHRLLNPGGFIVIKTPLHSPALFSLARLFSFTGRSRTILHIPAQIHHFDKKSLPRILHACGFQPVKILQVKEYYQHGKPAGVSFPVFLWSQMRNLISLCGLCWSLLVIARRIKGKGEQ